MDETIFGLLIGGYFYAMKKVTQINSRVVGCLLLLVVSRYMLTAQTAHEENLKLFIVQLTVTGFKDDNGQAILNIFNSSDGFPSDFSKAYRSLKGKIIENRITFRVELPAGLYAFGCVHDENSNNQMEKNILGIPKEGAGLSNYSRGGYPSYDKAKVHISENTSLQIKIRYL